MYKLDKPYTTKERAIFVIENGQGTIAQETDTALYLLEPWEKLIDGEVIEDKEAYEAEQAQKEEERINNLTMTALDFIGVLQSFGLTLEQINEYLENNLAVKMQLTYCQNVYCGVAKQLMPVTLGDITITADMVEIAFRNKNGETIEDINSGKEPIEGDNALVEPEGNEEIEG